MVEKRRGMNGGKKLLEKWKMNWGRGEVTLPSYVFRETTRRQFVLFRFLKSQWVRKFITERERKRDYVSSCPVCSLQMEGWSPRRGVFWNKTQTFKLFPSVQTLFCQSPDSWPYPCWSWKNKFTSIYGWLGSQCLALLNNMYPVLAKKGVLDKWAFT